MNPGAGAAGISYNPHDETIARRERCRASRFHGRPRHRARQDRRLRRRRGAARKIFEPREVPRGDRQESRILRRDPRMGLERSAVRQHPIHRMAHGVSRRLGEDIAGHAPRDSVRTQDGAVSRRIRGSGGIGLPARNAAAGVGARSGHGLCGGRCGGVRVLHVRGNAEFRARQGLSAAEDHDPGRVRLFGAAQLGAFGSLSGAAEPRSNHAFPDRGAAHRDRAGRARGGAHLLRGARGRGSCGAVQDLHQGAGAAPRPDGDVHGQVVQRGARPERPSAHFAARADGDSVFHDATQAAARCRTPCAGSSAASRR